MGSPMTEIAGMRVLVTGGRGILGSAVCDCFKLLGHHLLATGSSDFDITDLIACRSSILSFKPDVELPPV